MTLLISDTNTEERTEYSKTAKMELCEAWVAKTSEFDVTNNILRQRHKSASELDGKTVDTSDILEDEKIGEKTKGEIENVGDIYADEKEKCEDCDREKHKDIEQTANSLLNNKDNVRARSTGSDISSSTRKRLVDYGPRWLISLAHDPEFVMTEQKKVDKDTVHKHADSLFSTSSGFNNYRGLLNLCIILLVLSNARLFLENIIKYGILIDPVQTFNILFSQPYSWPNLGLLAVSVMFIQLCFYTEVGLSKGYVSESVALVVHSTNLVLLLVIPAATILYVHPNPIFSAMTCGLYTVIFMKLVSYASVNKWCRQAMSPGRRRMRRTKSVSINDGDNVGYTEESAPVSYPGNLNYSDLYYFMCAPTLCYELNFPRTLRIRKRFLLKRFVEMLFLFQLMIGLIQQWMIPAVSNSMKPLQDMNITHSLERLLKLAIPNHFIWLLFFYWFFHSVLNVIAELLKFGDREFYQDWWNSETVSQFWKLWNVPVHRWAHRHLYKPLLKRGCSRFNASLAVFFLSAFFHEYLVSVPLNMFKIWAFMGMIGQVPLALVQGKYIHGKYGNMVVWLSLILGQPIAILAYVHDYYVLNTIKVQEATNQTLSGM